METQAESTTMMRESSLANAIADLETKLGPGQLQRFVEVCDRVIAQHGEDGFTDHFSNELLSSIDLISLAAVKGKKHVRGHVRGLQQETWGLRPWQLIAKFGCSALHSQTFVARLRTLSSISDYQSACTKIQAARQARLASDGCGKGIRRHDSFIPDDVQRAIDQFAQPYTPITHPRKRARDATDPCEDSASRERSIEIGRGIEAPSKRSWLSPDLESMPDELPDTYDSDVNVDADDPDGRIVFDDTDFFEQPDAISTPRNFTAAQLSTVHDNGKSYTLDMETHEEGIEGTENVGHNTQSLEHRANTSRAPNISVRMARKSIEVQNLGRLAEATSQVSSVETSQGDRGKHDEKDHEQQAMVKPLRHDHRTYGHETLVTCFQNPHEVSILSEGICPAPATLKEIASSATSGKDSAALSRITVVEAAQISVGATTAEAASDVASTIPTGLPCSPH